MAVLVLRCSAAMGSPEVPGSREEHIYVHSKWLFQLIIGQGKAHWFAVSVGVFVVHEQKESI